MSNKVPTPYVDGRPIQPVVITDQYGNLTADDTTIPLASQSRSATPAAVVISNAGATGIALILDITVAPNNTETLTINVSTAAGTNPQVFATFASQAGSAIQAGMTYFLQIHPGASSTPANGTQNKAYALAIPSGISVVVTHSASSAWTYSLTSQLIP